MPPMANTAATTLTIDSSASDRIAVEPVIRYAWYFAASSRTDTTSETRPARRRMPSPMQSSPTSLSRLLRQAPCPRCARRRSRRSAHRSRSAGDPVPPRPSPPRAVDPDPQPRSSAHPHRHVLALAGAGVDLARPGNLLLRVLDHLLPLGEPAGGPGYREEDGEHLDRESHRLVDQPGVEVDVRVELARHEVVVLERDPLELERDRQQGVRPGHLEGLVGHPLDDLRPGIVVLVHAVAEPHQLRL